MDRSQQSTLGPMETAASTEVGTSIEEKRTEMQTSCTTQPCATAGGDIPALVDHAGLNRHTCLASQTTTHSMLAARHHQIPRTKT